jgi:hypothetical protein
MKKLLQYVWEVLIEIGEARQASYKQHGFKGYY